MGGSIGNEGHGVSPTVFFAISCKFVLFTLTLFEILDTEFKVNNKQTTFFLNNQTYIRRMNTANATQTSLQRQTQLPSSP